MYNREAINILLWKAEMPCLNVWGVSQASQLCGRCHMSPEMCTTTFRTGSGLFQDSYSGLTQDSYSGLDQDSLRTHIHWLRTGLRLTQDSYSGLDQDSLRTHIQDWIRTHTDCL